MSDDTDPNLAPNGAPFQPPDDVLVWVRGRSLADLRAIEATIRGADGEFRVKLFPDVLRYRNARGDQCEVPVLFKIPDDDDLSQATQDATAHIAKQWKRDPKTLTPEEARALVGATRFANIETAATIAICAREVKEPHPPAYMLWLLIKEIGPDGIADAFERLEMLRRTWTVRMSSITEAQFWALCGEIARVRNLGPLAVLAPSLQDAFIIEAANRLTISRTSPSSSGSESN